MRIHVPPLRVHALFLGCLVLGGCEEALPTAFLDDAPHAPIQTDREVYDLDWNGAVYRADLDYTFTNRTGSDVFVVNCHGSFALRLERWTGERWVSAWSPALPLCLSEPIVIPAGETQDFSLAVVGAKRGSDAYPTFDTSDPTGWYRIIWMAALSSFESGHPFGPEIAPQYRYSNPFRFRTR